MGFSIIRLLLAALSLMFIGSVCGILSDESSLVKTNLEHLLLENNILPYLQSIPIPEQTGKKGSVQYKASNFRIEAFTLPKISVQNLQQNPLILKLTVEGGGISGKFDFWFRYKTWLLRHTDDGYVNLSAGKIGLEIKVTADLANKSIQVNSCSSPRTSIRLKFHGTRWAWIYNIFKGILANELEKRLSGSDGLICKGVTKAIIRGEKKIFDKLEKIQG
ncbi:uncharacterized protein LOC134234230 [Saccostrea cucullata]|uniref:uncharacterized protein LOC134234230 n=1 Tax=Saccostrea cuccullata TaxID=36930 RepID=UPI002ED2E7B4